MSDFLDLLQKLWPIGVILLVGLLLLLPDKKKKLSPNNGGGGGSIPSVEPSTGEENQIT